MAHQILQHSCKFKSHNRIKTIWGDVNNSKDVPLARISKIRCRHKVESRNANLFVPDTLLSQRAMHLAIFQDYRKTFSLHASAQLGVLDAIRIKIFIILINSTSKSLGIIRADRYLLIPTMFSDETKSVGLQAKVITVSVERVFCHLLIHRREWSHILGRHHILQHDLIILKSLDKLFRRAQRERW
jgi:hypothetical protein